MGNGTALPVVFVTQVTHPSLEKARNGKCALRHGQASTLAHATHTMRGDQGAGYLGFLPFSTSTMSRTTQDIFSNAV